MSVVILEFPYNIVVLFVIVDMADFFYLEGISLFEVGPSLARPQMLPLIFFVPTFDFEFVG